VVEKVEEKRQEESRKKSKIKSRDKSRKARKYIGRERGKSSTNICMALIRGSLVCGSTIGLQIRQYTVVFILKTHYPSGQNWAIILLFVWLCVSSIKTGTRRIMRPDELPFVVRSSRHISKESPCVLCLSLFLRPITRRTTSVCPSSSRRIMRPVV